MNYHVQLGVVPTDITAFDKYISYVVDGEEKKLAYEDIINVKKVDNKEGTYRINYIKDHPFPDHTLTKESIEFITEENTFTEFQNVTKDRIDKITQRPKKLVVFVNPIGGKTKGKQVCDEIVLPMFTSAGIQSDVVVSQKPGHAKEFAEEYDFKSVDGIVIMGGDGTISEIFNVMMRKTQQEAGVDFNDSNAHLKTMEFPIGIIPTGTGNGLANVVYGCKDILTATLHILKGRKIKHGLIATYNDNELSRYCIVCWVFGLFSQIQYYIDVYYRWMRHLRFAFVPIWYMFIRPIREIDVEITYEYLNDNEPNDLSDEEKKTLKVTEKKRIINVLALAYNLEFEDMPLDKQPVRQDQFDLFDYKKCGRLALLKHFVNLHRLSKEYLDNVQYFLKHSEVTAFRLRIPEDSDSRNDEFNLMYNVDGEVYKIKTPDVYVKLFPRCFNVFTSYNGARRWW